MRVTRRIAIGGLLTGAGLLFSSGYSMMDALAKPVRQRKPTTIKEPGELKAGQSEWHPERSPSGPLFGRECYLAGSFRRGERLALRR